jgi:hypothetical protein
MDPTHLARFFVVAFFAACFLQSGFDKVFDWKANLDWLKGHFAQTPFRNGVPLMLGVVTVLEVIGGLMCALVAVLLWAMPAAGLRLGVFALGIVALTLLFLFTGQRVAKDYPGACTLASYFMIALLGLVVFPSP